MGSIIMGSVLMTLCALDDLYERTVLQRRATVADVHAHRHVETWCRTCSTQTLTPAVRLGKVPAWRTSRYPLCRGRSCAPTAPAHLRSTTAVLSLRVPFLATPTGWHLEIAWS